VGANATDPSAEHYVDLVSGTRLAGILGAERLIVNSRHHQGVCKPEKAAGLVASAFAEDGMIEALESPEHHWVVAVQWHPERADAPDRESCRKLFKAFVKASAGV
jgi:putative glutamine amidotransferase